MAELLSIGIANTLQKCQLFAGLSDADLKQVASIIMPKSLARGEYLFHEGDPIHGFYVVQRGAVNVHRVSAAGKEQVIHIFRAGESFAEAALVMDQGYPASARALEPTQVLLIPKNKFRELLRRKPELSLGMLCALSGRLHMVVSRLEDLTLKNVETRLANWLIRRCPDRYSEKAVRIELRMTKRTLAAELGTISETLSRSLAKFRAAKLLAVKGKTLTVLSPARLDAWLCDRLRE